MENETSIINAISQCIKDAVKAYEAGYESILVTHDDGSVQKHRLFASHGDVCYYRQKSKKYGYRLSPYNCTTWRSVKRHKLSRSSETFAHWFTRGLKSAKRAYTKEVHPNLWKDMQDVYSRLDVDEFIQFMRDLDINENDGSAVREAFRQYKDIHKIYGIPSEQYKRATIVSNAPRRGQPTGDYKTCVENIAKHLDNMEDFHYGWRAEYDVSVSGKMCEDGIYRAWLSLEFRGCGNGHYYLLINENSAVFCEDD